MTDTPVKDQTQTNRTLDSSPTTFPFGRSIYADFSHDDQITAIISAIGLFRQREFLDPTKPDPERTWHTSAIVPSSGRFVFERLTCSSNGKSEARIRVLAQDQVQPLEFCGADDSGLCTLNAFVESQSFARDNGNGDFEKCFADSGAS